MRLENYKLDNFRLDQPNKLIINAFDTVADKVKKLTARGVTCPDELTDQIYQGQQDLYTLQTIRGDRWNQVRREVCSVLEDLADSKPKRGRR